MRWSLLNTPLGLTDTSQRKMAGADLASLGFGVIGMALDWDAQTQANAINRQNAMETNQLNREINEQQIAWAKEKYRQEKAENRFLVDQAYRRELENRAYNSPQAQKLRYLKAGINPYLAMYGGASAGSQPSIGSTVGSPAKYDNPNMIPMQIGAPAQAYRGFGLGAQHMMDFHLAAERNQADIASLKTRTDLAALETFAKIKNYDWNNKHLNALTNQILQDVRFNQENWSAKSDALDLANQKIRADMDYQKSMTEYQNIVNKYAPKHQAQILSNLEAEYDNIYSAVHKNDEEAALAAANRALVGVETNTKERMADAIVDDAYNRANESYWNSQEAGKTFYEGSYEGKVLPGYNPINLKLYEYNRDGRHYYSGPYKRRRKDLDHVGK